MNLLSKITRILWKTVLFSIILAVFLIGTLFFMFQLTPVQTWAAKIATAYLSAELGTQVDVGKVKISFVKNLTLEDVFITDKHHDTLLYGQSIRLNVSNFNYKKQTLSLDELELKDTKVKLLRHKNEKDFNFQFLVDYFSSKDTLKKDTLPSLWKINYGTLVLNNIDFTYRLMDDTFAVGRNMNYDNLHVTNIYGKISDVNFSSDTISAQITNLKAKEQCGISLIDLTTKVKLSPVITQCDSLYLKTNHSLVKGNFSFNYTTWEDYLDFINKVYIKGNIKDSSYVNMKDITYFAEDINGFEEIFYLKGKVRGYVNDLSGKNLVVKYGKNTSFKGDFSITGLPDIDKSYIHFDAERLSTSRGDLEKFPIPPFNQPTFLDLPTELNALGVMTYKGKFDGFINNFATYGTFVTDIGTLKTDIQLNNNKKVVEYSGSIATTDFYFSKLFTNSKMIGPISLNAKIDGKGFTLKELDTKLDGTVQFITYNNYKYDNLKIDGAFKNKIFKGNLVSKDTSADFVFDGSVDLNGKIPKIDFISTVNNFDLQKTNFATSKLNGSVSSQIFIRLNGNDIDNLSGQINFDNTIYKTAIKSYTINTFDLTLDQENVLKKIKLNSSIANAKLVGKYKLSTLSDAFTQYLNAYFPTFIKSHSRYIHKDEVDVKIRIKNFEMIKELFINDLMISPNTIIEGSFDASISYLYLITNSDLIQYSGINFKNNSISVNSLPKGVSFNYKANAINLTDSFSFKNPVVNIIANDRITSFDFNWNNNMKPANSGSIYGNMLFGNSFAEIKFNKFKTVVADSLWQLSKVNAITIDTAFNITVQPTTFYNQNQLITFDGKLSKNVSDKFNILVQNFKLSQFNPFLSKAQTVIDGLLTANASINGAFGKSILSSRVDVNQFKINNRLIGNIEITSEYDPVKEAVSIDGFSTFAKDFDGNALKNVQFKGNYYPKKDNDNINLDFKAEPFDLALIQPLLKDILTFKVGYLTGKGSVTGSLAKPLINGKFKFLKCITVVDFLNVQYNINGDINITPNQINFDNMELRDKMGNTGSVNGNIFHNNFSDIRIDFDINTNKLMALNTTAANNPSYYGTAYASGNAGIYGFLDDIKMEINMKTNGGTYFYIPLDGPSEIGSNDFIRFVTKDTIKKIVKTSSSNFSLDFNLEATPDAEVQLIFDAKSGDVIKARGAGNLNMKINSKGKFDMFGDYVLSNGDYLFTLENFVTKKFEIQKGSSIKWNGNVYKANIDITAIYRQRSSLRPIYPADSSGKRYTVDCELYMKDKLTQPNISFGINLPTVDENARSTIKSILTDENELNRQVFSLLLLKSFVTPIAASGGGGITAGGAVANTGSEMLSNKLSNWLNGVANDIDVGLNYRPGTGLSSDELDLTLNKQMFNNRLIIDGNFGVNNSSTKNTNSSNLIGDVTFEYKLTDSGKYRVKAFNRSNDNTQVINTGGPFTQGVGIFYREEFETLNELYRRYLKKMKKTIN